MQSRSRTGTSTNRKRPKAPKKFNPPGPAPKAGGLTPHDGSRLVGPMLRRTLLLIYAGFGRKFGPGMLPTQRFAVLRIVGLYPGLTQSDVAARLQIAKSGLMVILNALEKQGLVLRQHHPTDKRVYNLVLTPNGVREMELYLRCLASHSTDLLKGISQHDQSIFFEVLSRIGDNASKGAPKDAQ